jgi:hypothetical protein
MLVSPLPTSHTTFAAALAVSPSCLTKREARLGHQVQDRTRMKPFVIERVWDAGKPVAVAERGSTLALLVEATVRRITAAATSPGGCPCCRCSSPIRRTAALQCVTVAVAHSDIEEYRVLVRAYCSRCAFDTADAMAACEHGAIPLRFRVRVPPSTVAKSALKQSAVAAT